MEEDMTRSGPDFYDVEKVFETYSDHRKRSDNPNETIEQPILWELIGDPSGLSVLDLGCGDAGVAKRFKAQGARRYVGIEGSARMVGRAKNQIEPGFSEIRHLRLEDCVPELDQYDLVISSLAIHYLEDLKTLFSKVRSSLRSGGRLVFSVEHPVITACNKSLEESPIRGAWLVDAYFERGARSVRWMGDEVTKYHRTVQDYLDLLLETGFLLERLRESDPPRQKFADPGLWSRRRRIPLFLLISARKS
jgi:SAM-dependent methyltransferase